MYIHKYVCGITTWVIGALYYTYWNRYELMIHCQYPILLGHTVRNCVVGTLNATVRYPVRYLPYSVLTHGCCPIYTGPFFVAFLVLNYCLVRFKMPNADTVGTVGIVHHLGVLHKAFKHKKCEILLDSDLLYGTGTVPVPALGPGPGYIGTTEM